MSSVDLFEHIKIKAMSESEKLELLDRGDEYLKILSKDDIFAIRIRAKKKLNESEAEQKARFTDDVADLLERSQSPVFGIRIKAKIILDRLRESGKI